MTTYVPGTPFAGSKLLTRSCWTTLKRWIVSEKPRFGTSTRKVPEVIALASFTLSRVGDASTTVSGTPFSVTVFSFGFGSKPDPNRCTVCPS
jgi:hypothetical protein